MKCQLSSVILNTARVAQSGLWYLGLILNSVGHVEMCLVIVAVED